MFKDLKVKCMADYDLSNLTQETLLLIVASTSGNGDPPQNAEKLFKHISVLKKQM